MKNRSITQGSISSEFSARLTLYGAAGEVTGSAFLLETNEARVLFECGMVQGGRDASDRNRQRFPFDPRTLDAVVLTHAHIDHSGLFPKLVRDGYGGRLFATGPTCELLRIMLPDSAHIQEGDARRDLRRSKRSGREAREPIYTSEDVALSLECMEPCGFDRRVCVAPGVDVCFRRAGHILGAASVEVWISTGERSCKVVFSGDIGRADEPLLLGPDPPEQADLVLMESTYGDRDHRGHGESLDELASVLQEAAAARESVLIPAFAVGRTQELLYFIRQLELEGRAPVRPVYLDSPMAIHVTELYSRHTACLRPEVQSKLAGDPRAAEPELLRFCRTPEESMALNDRDDAVIVAASGMCSGGRIVHHLKHKLWKPGAHVVIVGFQAEGTTGRAIVNGAKHVRILGEEVAVRAKVHTIGGFSAHAGQSGLLNWVRPLATAGAAVALIHGEPTKREALAEKLEAVSRREVLLPERGQEILIPRDAGARAELLGARVRAGGE